MKPDLVRALAGLCLIGCLVLVAHGLLLGLHFEPTTEAVADAARGRSVALPAGIGLVVSLAALLGAARRWAVAALALGVSLGALALVLALLR